MRGRLVSLCTFFRISENRANGLVTSERFLPLVYVVYLTSAFILTRRTLGRMSGIEVYIVLEKLISLRRM